MALLTSSVARCGTVSCPARLFSTNGFLARHLWDRYINVGTRLLLHATYGNRHTPQLFAIDIGLTLGIIQVGTVSAKAPYDRLASLGEGLAMAVYKVEIDRSHKYDLWASEVFGGTQRKIAEQAHSTAFYGANSKWCLLYDCVMRNITVANLPEGTSTNLGISVGQHENENLQELPTEFAQGNVFFSTTALDQVVLNFRYSRKAPEQFFLFDLEETWRTKTLALTSYKTWAPSHHEYFSNGFICTKADGSIVYVVRTMKTDWSAGSIVAVPVEETPATKMTDQAIYLSALHDTLFCVAKNGAYEIWDCNDTSAPRRVSNTQCLLIDSMADFVFVVSRNEIEIREALSGTLVLKLEARRIRLKQVVSGSP